MEIKNAPFNFKDENLDCHPEVELDQSSEEEEDNEVNLCDFKMIVCG